LICYLEQPCGRAVAGADAAAEAQDESSGVGDYSAGETAEADEVGNSEGGKAVDVVVAVAVACAVVVVVAAAAAVLVPAGTADTGEVVEGGRRRTGRYKWLALSVRKREGDCF
jgi:hypothetical protein